MKHIILASALLLLALVAPFPTSAAKTRPAATPTLQVSCGLTCTAGESIIYRGIGFKARSSAEINITGPSSYTLTVLVNSDGTFAADFGSGLSYELGNYTATASAMSGKSTTVLATAFFDVI